MRIEGPMAETRKVFGDIRLAAVMRRKLYYVSPILWVVAYDAYEWLEISASGLA